MRRPDGAWKVAVGGVLLILLTLPTVVQAQGTAGPQPSTDVSMGFAAPPEGEFRPEDGRIQVEVRNHGSTVIRNLTVIPLDPPPRTGTRLGAEGGAPAGPPFTFVEEVPPRSNRTVPLQVVVPEDAGDGALNATVLMLYEDAQGQERYHVETLQGEIEEALPPWFIKYAPGLAVALLLLGGAAFVVWFLQADEG